MVSTATPISREVATGHPTPGSARESQNVGDTERWLSLAGGGLLALYGLRQGDLGGLGLAALGAGLLHRGATGHCYLYEAMGTGTDDHSRVAAVAAGHGVKVTRAATINKPASELYRAWRNFEGLPRFMSHLVSVRQDGKRSHWVARAPAGFQVEWDAEIVTDEPDRLIGWRSLEGSTVATAGSVHFEQLPQDRGTVVKVTLKYDPPGGKLGSWLAWAFGEEPGQTVREDLRRFKQLMETGEVPTTEGQPACR